LTENDRVDIMECPFIKEEDMRKIFAASFFIGVLCLFFAAWLDCRANGTEANTTGWALAIVLCAIPAVVLWCGGSEKSEKKERRETWT
jgi:hypothetical protein